MEKKEIEKLIAESLDKRKLYSILELTNNNPGRMPLRIISVLGFIILATMPMTKFMVVADAMILYIYYMTCVAVCGTIWVASL
jgi:hypothetical protein